MWVLWPNRLPRKAHVYSVLCGLGTLSQTFSFAMDKMGTTALALQLL